MTPAQEAAVLSCTPDFPTWRIDARTQLRNRINSCHAVGVAALIRRCAIVQDRRGNTTELRRGMAPTPGARVGTRTYNLNPDNTVAIVDEWD